MYIVHGAHIFRFIVTGEIYSAMLYSFDEQDNCAVHHRHGNADCSLLRVALFVGLAVMLRGHDAQA